MTHEPVTHATDLRPPPDVPTRPAVRRRADHGRAAGGAGTARNRAVGAYGERRAVDALEACGLVVVDRNWRCERGEIDIVALDPGEARTGASLFTRARGVVVAEVKTRTSTRYGRPEHQITAAKAARLRLLAGCWLAEHPEVRTTAVRVDVIGVLVGGAGAPVVTHLRGVDR